MAPAERTLPTIGALGQCTTDGKQGCDRRLFLRCKDGDTRPPLQYGRRRTFTGRVSATPSSFVARDGWTKRKTEYYRKDK